MHYKKLLLWLNSQWLSDVAQKIEIELPNIYAELQGLADGCNRDFKEILLWNCRGDLSPTGPEGCSTVAVKHPLKVLISHNEDGDPNLRENCFILDATLDNGSHFITFVYPASIPGHTMGMNSYGLAYAVNNIRLKEKVMGIPRMVTARTLLEAKDTSDFISILKEQNRTGGFHYTVSDKRSLIPISIEAPFHGVSSISINTTSTHANHLIHQSFLNINQVITNSSSCRQKKLDSLILSKNEEINEEVCLNILMNTESELPIYRMSPDDPDEENTLATVIFTIQKDIVNMSIYDPITGEKTLINL